MNYRVDIGSILQRCLVAIEKLHHCSGTGIGIKNLNRVRHMNKKTALIVLALESEKL